MQLEGCSSGLLMRARASLAADGDRINVVPGCNMMVASNKLPGKWILVDQVGLLF